MNDFNWVLTGYGCLKNVAIDSKFRRSIFKLLVFAACVYYLIRCAAHLEAEQLRPVYLAVAAVVGVLYFLCTFLAAQSWRWLVLLFSPRPLPFTVLGTIYFRSALAKYIPSNVMHYAARHYLCRRFDIPHKTVMISNLLEITLVLMAAVCLAAVFLIFDPSLLPEAIAVDHSLLRIGVAAAAGGILALLAVVIHRKTSGLLPARAAVLKTLVSVFGVYLGFLLLTGLVLYALFQGIQPGIVLGGDLVLRIVFGYVCAWTLGFVTPGAPGGLGVREAVIVAVLGPVLGRDIALLGALLFRFSTLFGELLGYGFARFLESRLPFLPESDSSR